MNYFSGSQNFNETVKVEVDGNIVTDLYIPCIENVIDSVQDIFDNLEEAEEILSDEYYEVYDTCIEHWVWDENIGRYKYEGCI